LHCHAFRCWELFFSWMACFMLKNMISVLEWFVMLLWESIIQLQTCCCTLHLFYAIFVKSTHKKSMECKSERGHKNSKQIFENVSQFKYLERTVTNQNLIQGEIERLNSDNACYHSVNNFMSSRLLSKNLKIIIYN
jgi:hypothetical protein